MSQANVEIVRDGYDAFNRGDTDGSLAHIHPSIEWWPAADEPITEPYRGHEGYRRLVAAVRDGVQDIRAEIEELLAIRDQVVARVRFSGRGDASGVPAEILETQVARLRDGKIIEVHEYREWGDALEAVGLSE
jgi:ketosteroid isomerase-like protein